jgi:dihydroorotate dehydrogenase (fumarate)
MTDLSTTYLGLKIKNPIIVSSSGLTNSPEKILKIEKEGAGAVVLKSLFEEQINFEAGIALSESNAYPEAEDYIRNYSKSNSVDAYLHLISDTKKQVSIPVMASIHCNSDKDWTGFARNIESAGADALELNMNIVTVNPAVSSGTIEDYYLSISEKVKSLVKIPVAVKIGSHFTNLPSLVDRFYHRRIDGVVLFNRFYQPDIDIDNFTFHSSSVFSSENDLRNTLRWVGIISDRIGKIEISASTGVHDGKAAIKLLLAGATSVQICSVLYKYGIEHLPVILSEMSAWMESKGFKTIDDFRGKMSYRHFTDSGIYERAQFMKYFSSLE